MWLVMRGALSSNIKKLHQAYYLPSMTGIAVALYENEAIAPPADVDIHSHYLAHVRHQMQGVEALEGTYPFTYERSVKGYRLNKFLHSLIEEGERNAFRADEEAAFRKAGLTDEEARMVRERDWKALIRYGASFFMLEKLGAVVGVSNLHIYAAMRGLSLEDFQKTRNTQVLYSVAGGPAPKKEPQKVAGE
jgi:gallate dioxygenase